MISSSSPLLFSAALTALLIVPPLEGALTPTPTLGGSASAAPAQQRGRAQRGQNRQNRDRQGQGRQNQGNQRRRRGGDRAAQQFEQGIRGGIAGVRLGLTMSSLGQSRSSDPFIQDPGVGFGFNGGVTYDRGFNKLFGIRLGANFSQRSFSHRAVSNYGYDEESEEYIINTSGDNPSRYEDSETTLNSVEIPLSLQFRFKANPRLRPFAYLGGYFSLLLAASGTHEEAGNNSEARAPFSSLDAGWLVGGGVYWILPPGSGFISADLRLSGSLGNVADTDAETRAGESLKQQIYQPFTTLLALTYHFSL